MCTFNNLGEILKTWKKFWNSGDNLQNTFGHPVIVMENVLKVKILNWLLNYSVASLDDYYVKKYYKIFFSFKLLQKFYVISVKNFK